MAQTTLGILCCVMTIGSLAVAAIAMIALARANQRLSEVNAELTLRRPFHIVPIQLAKGEQVHPAYRVGPAQQSDAAEVGPDSLNFGELSGGEELPPLSDRPVDLGQRNP